MVIWGEVHICIWPSWCHCHKLFLASVNPDWFYLPHFSFPVPAQPGSSGQILLLLLVFCCLAGHWLPSLQHITNICLPLVSLLFHIPRICCSSTVVSFSLSYISQSSCLLECLAITHHVGEHALAICVSVDLSRWWYCYFPQIQGTIKWLQF